MNDAKQTFMDKMLHQWVITLTNIPVYGANKIRLSITGHDMCMICSHTCIICYQFGTKKTLNVNEDGH
jgi:hypothetical protein